ncbi:MAG: general secretion pathway protein GspN [Burkholderiales bacterium PBB5]|nr:MAG: general secretion pathway protein GspN [Burkholderiales bacterium PBB5]
MIRRRRARDTGVQASTFERLEADTVRWRRQQRAGRRWAIWGAVLGVLGALITQAPAQWLANGLQQATGSRLLLAEARGSVWNGSAVLVLTGGEGSRDAAALPGRLNWRLRPDWRGLQLSASQACCLQGEMRLHLQPGWGGYTVTLDTPADASGKLGQWPAAWLAGLGTPWNTLQLGGQLQLASGGLRLQSTQGRVQLEGTLALTLQSASSRVSPLPVLGSYLLQVQGTGAGAGNAVPTVQLSTLDGVLLLSGNGQWTGARLRFRGQAEAAEGHAAALSNLLNIIGRRQGALSVISIG